MASKKQNDFIKEIIKKSNIYRSFDELSEFFDVSTRSIRNYCADFEDFLNENKLNNLLQYTKNGITYLGSKEQSEVILKRINEVNLYDYHLNNDERILLIVLTLLTSNEKQSIQSFMDLLYISKSTFLNDINKVKTYFEQFQIELLSSPKGYYLEIDEQKRQDTICTTVFPRLKDSEANASNNFNISVIYKILKVAELQEATIDALNDTESLFNIQINDIFYRQTVFALSLLCSRLNEGYHIDNVSHIDKELLKSFVGKIAKILLNHCHKIFNFEYSENDVLYLAWRLHLCHFDLLQEFDHSIDFYFYSEVLHFLTQLDKEINTSFINDYDFTLMLTRHIWSIRNGNLNEGDIGGKELIEEYQNIYQIIRNNINIIESCIGRTCNETELLSILLYVVSQLERQSWNKNKVRVIVLCHVGIGTGYYLSDRLSESFNMQIIDVASIHELPKIKKRNDYDFIISTVSLDNEAVDYIKVAPSLQDSDIVAIQKKIVNIQKTRNKIIEEKKNNFSLKDVINPKYITINEDCDDWKQSLSIAAKPLLEDKKISNNYIDAIIDSIHKNGPYFVFCPGVALVHAAAKDGVNEFCISIYRPNKPIKYNHEKNDPVKLVVMVGVNNPELQVSYITLLMKLLSNAEILNKILLAKSKEEIISILLNEN